MDRPKRQLKKKPNLMLKIVKVTRCFLLDSLMKKLIVNLMLVSWTVEESFVGKRWKAEYFVWQVSSMMFQNDVMWQMFISYLAILQWCHRYMCNGQHQLNWQPVTWTCQSVLTTPGLGSEVDRNCGSQMVRWTTSTQLNCRGSTIFFFSFSCWLKTWAFQQRRILTTSTSQITSDVSMRCCIFTWLSLC